MAPETGQADAGDATPRDPEDQPPAPESPPSPASPPAESIVPGKAREDTDVGWGDYADYGDDDRLLRDRPPHWGNG